MTTTISPELNEKIGSLSSLVRGRTPTADTAGQVLLVPVESVKPGPHQPRKTFHKVSLEELAATIKRDGVTVPLIVRRSSGGDYELIAGERRWRAAKIAGLRQVPVIVRELDDASARRHALIDNIQREDLCLADEVTAIAHYVADLGSARAVAEVLGKSDQWVSKRNILATNPHPLVRDLLTSGRSADADGLLELNRLASKDEAAAKAAVASLQHGASLRNLLKQTKETTPRSSDAKKARAADLVRKTKAAPAILVTKVEVSNGTLRVSTKLGTIDLAFNAGALATLGKMVSKMTPATGGLPKGQQGRGPKPSGNAKQRG